MYFAQVPERVLTKSLVVLVIGNSKLNHVGALRLTLTSLQLYCTTFAQYTTLPLTHLLYAIHHTILVMTISFKGPPPPPPLPSPPPVAWPRAALLTYPFIHLYLHICISDASLQYLRICVSTGYHGTNSNSNSKFTPPPTQHGYAPKL